jgi:hypothetical protein
MPDAGRQQLTLDEPFRDADAAEAERRAERRAYLVGALAQVRASSDLRIFVTAVYRHAGEPGRWWAVTMQELTGETAAPGAHLDPLTDRLGCSLSSAKRVSALSRRLGLVMARPAGRAPSRDGVADLDWQPGESLEYQIDWVGVRRRIGLESRLCGERIDKCQPDTSKGQPDTSKGQPDTSKGQPDTSEICPIRNTRAPAVPLPIPVRVFERKQERDGTGTGAVGPRLLDGVTLGVMRDTRQLLELLTQVCAVSPIGGLTDCEADQLWWITAAEFALRCGKNPVSYWRYLIHGNRRGIPKLVDEDAARKRLKEVEACLT